MKTTSLWTQRKLNHLKSMNKKTAKWCFWFNTTSKDSSWSSPCRRGVASPSASPPDGRTTWPWPPWWSSRTPRGSPLCPRRAAAAGRVIRRRRSLRHAPSLCPARRPCRKAYGLYPSDLSSVTQAKKSVGLFSMQGLFSRLNYFRN